MSGSRCSTRACRSCSRPGPTGRATLDGKHYQVDGAIVRPLPLQEGGIPLWIAGGGEKVTLRDRGEVRAVHQLRRHPRGLHPQVRGARAGTAATVGTDFDAIIRSANYNVAIGATEAEVDDRLALLQARIDAVRRRGGAEAQLAAFRGQPGSAPRSRSSRSCRKLEAGLDLRDHYFPEAAYDPSGIELFEREVPGAALTDR